MASNPGRLTDEGIYNTPQDKVDEALRRMKNESIHADQGSQRGYKLYSTSESTISSSSNISEMEEAYVLEDKKTIQSKPEVSSRKKKKAVVVDLFDEDNYSIANVNNCVTKQAGVLVEINKSEHRKTVTEGRKSWFTKKKLTVVGVIILLICLGGISGIILTMVTGNIYIYIYHFI
jgi:hypothetical protein